MKEDEMKDFDAEFAKIVSQLGDLESPEIAISLIDISRVVERLNEAALYLGKYVSKVIESPRGTPVDCPDELVTILPPLVVLCETLSDLVHDYVCDCGNCDCDEDESCPICSDEELDE